jgi:glycogen debranching enzyme
VDLVARAAALKRLVKETLWDAKDGWFDNIDTGKGGRRDRRWTMQMFKALGWGDWAIDPDVERALVGHLMDESEFLGPYGLHSLSKKDPAYDVNDVDNGGPGACVSFAPAVVDRLYRSGRIEEAEKIFRRLWWLGGALPYWGDSHYADRMDYRRDTPLQNDIQGAALAQTVIFGLFGIEPKADGTIEVAPHLPKGVDRMNLRNVRLNGRILDIFVGRSQGVKVVVDGKTVSSPLGAAVTLPR